MPVEPTCPRCLNPLSPLAGVLSCRCCGYRDLLPVAAMPASNDVLLAGLDLGKTADHSALTVWRRRVEPKSGKADYAAMLIQRWPLGSSYRDDIIPKTIAFMQSPQLRSAFLVIDASGVGSGLLEFFAVEGLAGRIDPVVTTGGNGWRRDEETGRWNVSKIELCSTVQRLLSSGRIKVRVSDGPEQADMPKLSAASMFHVEQLKTELLNFQERHKLRTGGTTFGAKTEAIHDDLAMSAAVALFIGEHGGFGQCDPTPNPEAAGLVSKAPRGVFASDEMKGERPW